MAVLIIAAWAVGYYASTLNLGRAKLSAVELHKSIATITLFLIAMRIVWRLTHRPPALTSSSVVMRTVARVGHVTLYILMVALPLSGWAWSSAVGYTIPVAKLFHLPALMATNSAVKPVLEAIHVWLAWAMGILIVGHVLAGVKHHFVDRDDVLGSMLSRGARRHFILERPMSNAAPPASIRQPK